MRTVTDTGDREEFIGYTISELEIDKSCENAGLPQGKTEFVSEAEVRMLTESAHSNCTFTPGASTPFHVRVIGEPEATVEVDAETSIIGC